VIFAAAATELEWIKLDSAEDLNMTTDKIDRPLKEIRL
jgi:hypothetical protein